MTKLKFITLYELYIVIVIPVMAFFCLGLILVPPNLIHIAFVPNIKTGALALFAIAYLFRLSLLPFALIINKQIDIKNKSQYALVAVIFLFYFSACIKAFPYGQNINSWLMYFSNSKFVDLLLSITFSVYFFLSSITFIKLLRARKLSFKNPGHSERSTEEEDIKPHSVEPVANDPDTSTKQDIAEPLYTNRIKAYCIDSSILFTLSFLTVCICSYLIKAFKNGSMGAIPVSWSEPSFWLLAIFISASYTLLCATGLGFSILIICMDKQLAIFSGKGLAYFANSERIPHNIAFIGLLTMSIISILYYSLSEASTSKGTIGKRLTGLEVLNERDNQLSLSESIVRYFCRGLSVLFISGYFTPLISKNSQCLHDLLAKTKVVQKTTAFLLILICLNAYIPSQCLAQGNSSEQENFSKLINQTAAKVLKKLNGNVPADLQSRVSNVLDKRLSNKQKAKLQDLLEKKIPKNIQEKLPPDLSKTISNLKTVKIENLSYWPEENSPAHQMTLYLPHAEKGKKLPLIMFIHGGAWISGRGVKQQWTDDFVKSGYALAFVNYTLAQEGPFPAQMADLNTALRYLKQNAEKLNIDPDRIGIWGASAGGHLAALMGTSWNSNDMNIGGSNKSISRKVKAVCDWCGPIDLYELGTKTFPGVGFDWHSANCPLTLFLKGQVDQKKDLAIAASPNSYIQHQSKNAADAFPPFLIVHGSADTIVPVGQSDVFAKDLKDAGANVTYTRLEGVDHNVENRETLKEAKAFFDKYLK